MGQHGPGMLDTVGLLIFNKEKSSSTPKFVSSMDQGQSGHIKNV